MRHTNRRTEAQKEAGKQFAADIRRQANRNRIVITTDKVQPNSEINAHLRSLATPANIHGDGQEGGDGQE